MESIILEFVKSNPNGAFMLLAILIILPVPAQMLTTWYFLKFIRETLKINQVLFNRFENMQNRDMNARGECSKSMTIFSEIIRKFQGTVKA